MTDQLPELTDGACAEYQSLSRRNFLCGSKAAAITIATAPVWLPKIASAGSPPTRDVLVTIFLRGGTDALSAVVPYGDADLYNLRPTLAIQPPGGTNGAIDLDGFFGLPPAAAPLLTPYNDSRLLLVHAAGSLDPTRSHFDAQHFMETATPPNSPTFGLSSGWVSRHLQTIGPMGTGEFRGMALAASMPRTLTEAPASLPIPNPATFDFPGNPASLAARRAALEGMYAKAREPMKGAAAAILDTIDLLATIDYDNYTPENGAVYSSHYLHQAFRNAAATIKGDIDVEAIHLDFNGWDHHDAMGPIDGIFASMTDILTKGLEAFYLDLLSHWDHVTLVAASEFGRRGAENGSSGTDHGHGGFMYVMGGHIDGGRVLASWPGLDEASLDQGDLAVTIDYRDILSEIVQVRLGNTNLGAVFPGYTPNFQGITI